MSDAIVGMQQAARILGASAALLDGVPEKEELEALSCSLEEASESGAAAELRGLCDRSDGDALKELRVEATALFWGYRLDAPHPYASVYVGGSRRLMGDEAVAVAREYSGFGFEPQSSGEEAEPPDYLPYELRFAAHLAETAVNGDAGAEEELLRFSSRHLLSWLPSFLVEVETAAESAFYPALIRFLIEVLSGL